MKTYGVVLGLIAAACCVPSAGAQTIFGSPGYIPTYGLHASFGGAPGYYGTPSYYGTPNYYGAPSYYGAPLYGQAADPYTFHYGSANTSYYGASPAVLVPASRYVGRSARRNSFSLGTYYYNVLPAPKQDNSGNRGFGEGKKSDPEPVSPTPLPDYSGDKKLTDALKQEILDSQARQRDLVLPQKPVPFTKQVKPGDQVILSAPNPFTGPATAEALPAEEVTWIIDPALKLAENANYYEDSKDAKLVLTVKASGQYRTSATFMPPPVVVPWMLPGPFPFPVQTPIVITPSKPTVVTYTIVVVGEAPPPRVPVPPTEPVPPPKVPATDGDLAKAYTAEKAAKDPQGKSRDTLRAKFQTLYKDLDTNRLIEVGDVTDRWKMLVDESTPLEKTRTAIGTYLRSTIFADGQPVFDYLGRKEKLNARGSQLAKKEYLRILNEVIQQLSK